jgi:hypothetical protein
VVSKEILSRRTADYQNWVEAFARNHHTPIEWAEKGVRKEDYVPALAAPHGEQERLRCYFIFKSMEQGPTFASACRNIPARTHTTASSPASAAASHITTSTSAMTFSAPW